MSGLCRFNSLYFRQFSVDFLLISTWKSILWSPFKSLALRKALLFQRLETEGLQLKDHPASPDSLFLHRSKNDQPVSKSNCTTRGNTFWKCLTFLMNKSMFFKKKQWILKWPSTSTTFFQMMFACRWSRLKKNNKKYNTSTAVQNTSLATLKAAPTECRAHFTGTWWPVPLLRDGPGAGMEPSWNQSPPVQFTARQGPLPNQNQAGPPSPCTWLLLSRASGIFTGKLDWNLAKSVSIPLECMCP